MHFCVTGTLTYEFKSFKNKIKFYLRFEETGLLIANEHSKQSKITSNCYNKNHTQLKEWRKRIKNYPEDFILLFKGK